MVSAKRLAQLANKCRGWRSWGGKLTWSLAALEKETKGSCNALYSHVACKGHCIVYTADGVWFKVSLAFLGMVVFSELLRLSQKEFGFTGRENKITLPCDAKVMEYDMCLIKRSATAKMEAAFLSSMATPLRCKLCGTTYGSCPACCSL